MWQIVIMSCVRIIVVVFNLVSLFFKIIQFCHLQFVTKLVIKLNYSLYIHVKIIFYDLY